MPFAQANDIRIYHEVKGTGPRLLVVSGTSGDLRRKRGFLESPLPDRFTVLAYDQRGLGQSDKPDRRYRMSDYADDAAALLDAVGWERACVLGVSFGGMVAQELAIRYPDKVERLALVSTTSGGSGGSSYPLHKLFRVAPHRRARRLLSLRDLRCDEAWIAANPGPARALMENWNPLASTDRESARGSFRQLAARARHDTFDRLPGLSMPVAVFAGRYDGIAPLQAQQAMAAQIRQASFQVFEGGHLFWVEDMVAFPALTAFLSG